VNSRTAIFALVLSLVPLRSLEAQQDAWTSIAPMPTARESVAACTVADRIYAVGGFPGGSDSGLQTNERFDPGANAWAARAPMPTGRRMPVTGTVGGKCYVIGGRVSDGPRAMDVVEEYDPASDSWRTRANMPTARFGHGAAVIDDIVYVVGGGEGGVAFGVLEAYDPATNSWSTRKPLPSPRPLAGVTALDGKLYVIGGLVAFGGGGTNGIGTTRVDRYDPETDTWSIAAALPKPLFGLSAAAARGRVYAIGGADGPGAVNDVFAYDPALDQWTAVASMQTSRTRFAATTVADQIYAIGGALSFDVPHVGMALAESYLPEETTSPAFELNAGLTDAWYDAETAGQGFFIVLFPETGLMFLSWFTYETASRPADAPAAKLGEPYHRWLTALGGWQGNRADLDVTMSSGGLFDDPAAVTNTPPGSYGSIEIQFHDCSSATLNYDLFAIGESGEIPLARIVGDRVALCESLR
jgi:N-acetylneuraminic acid mutarotase